MQVLLSWEVTQLSVLVLQSLSYWLSFKDLCVLSLTRAVTECRWSVARPVWPTCSPADLFYVLCLVYMFFLCLFSFFSPQTKKAPDGSSSYIVWRFKIICFILCFGRGGIGSLHCSPTTAEITNAQTCRNIQSGGIQHKKLTPTCSSERGRARA